MDMQPVCRTPNCESWEKLGQTQIHGEPTEKHGVALQSRRTDHELFAGWSGRAPQQDHLRTAVGDARMWGFALATWTCFRPGATR